MSNQQKKQKAKWPVLFLISCIFSMANLMAQNEMFNKQDFFNRLNNSYYKLSDTGLKNMTISVTSLKMDRFSEEVWPNTKVFPIQLTWLNPNRIFISQVGVPKISEDQYKNYQEIVDGLKMQLTGILLDLQRFYFNGVVESIPDDYVLQTNEEAVQVSFSSKDNVGVTKVKYLFGYNGKNLLLQIYYPSQNKQLNIYPEFKTVKNKWFCTGWSVQTYQNNEIISGFNVTLKNRYVNEVWVPGEIIIKVQQAEKQGQTFYDVIKLENFLFDQPVEVDPVPTKEH